MSPVFNEFEAELVERAEALARASEARTERSPRRRVLGAGFGLAVMASVVAVVVGLSSGGRIGVAEQAAAALAPRGELLHLVTTSRFGTEGRPLGAPQRAEQWLTDNPVRWRVVTTAPATDRGVRADTQRDELGPITGPVEYAYAGDALSVYVRDRNTLQITTGVGRSLAGAVPSPVGGPNLDLDLAGLRQLVARGRLKDAGSSAVRGRRVSLLRGMIASDPVGSGPRLAPARVELAVDAKTFSPVRITVRQTLTGGGPALIHQADVVRFERLPVTAERLRMLEIRPTRSPRIVRRAR